jgi:lipid II:glycine glycyltransferase (peptidoglycan interpeptide bridge formation enzyme)
MLSAVPAGKLKLFIAYSSEGEALGGILVSFYGGVATYLHGASSGKNRNLMANYGLQWHAIEKAKETGVKKYDLGGTALESDKKGWEGITKFKRGFCPGGEPVKFPGCYDLIINPWAYFLYRLLRKIKI